MSNALSIVGGAICILIAAACCSYCGQQITIERLDHWKREHPDIVTRAMLAVHAPRDASGALVHYTTPTPAPVPVPDTSRRIPGGWEIRP